MTRASDVRPPVPAALRRQVPPQYVTYTKPFVDPTPTAPLHMGPSCPDCDRGKHVWRRLGSERMNDRVWLTRWRCGCGRCGRCGAGSVGVDFEGRES